LGSRVKENHIHEKVNGGWLGIWAGLTTGGKKKTGYDQGGGENSSRRPIKKVAGKNVEAQRKKDAGKDLQKASRQRTWQNAPKKKHFARRNDVKDITFRGN